MSPETPREPRLVPTRFGASYGVTGEARGASWPATEEKLAASRNYWVCTTRADGSPHSKPVWGYWHEGALWFGSGGVAAANLARDSRVSVHLESGDDVVILEGSVEVRRVPEEALAAYARKYAMKPEDIGGEDASDDWFYLAPRKALTWVEADFPNTAARWDFD
ncbi:MAG: pyridoxamine 5'-phosphate oxidase family protein [Dehalococcoidia bacterium]|nr:pyridoxamine 5'-phosphate oxidase family protein [Dehalococcoidia bacterium]